MTVLISTHWIKAAKYDPLMLLAHLKPALYEQECEKVISTLLQVSADSLKDLSEAEVRAFRLGMNSQPKMDALYPENLLLARLQCQHEQSPTKKADMLHKIVPDIPMLCDTIHNYLDDGSVQNSQDEASIFCCNQLFKLVQIMDLQEEGSRRHFRTFSREILASTNTPDDVLEEAIKAMSRAHDRQEDYVNCVAEIVEPMTDPLRIVSIVTLVLENTSPRMAGHSSIKNFVGRVVPAVTNSDPLVREAGVGCLGRLALLSEEASVLQEFKPLLLQIVANEQEKLEIRAQAMLAMSDLAMLFETILVSMDLDGKSVNLVECVRDMLSNENPAVVAVAAEIASKLLFSGKVQDIELVAALLVVFFNKIYDDYDEDDDIHEVGSVYRMQQLLSIFFPAFTMKGFKLVPAIGPMLSATATRKRGRKPFPIAKMIEYVYSTVEVVVDETVKDKNTNGETPREENGTAKSNNALLVCLEISNFLIHSGDNLSITNLRTLCKLLGGADVELDNSCTKTLTELKEKVNELSMIITDEAALESLETMVELLEDVQEEKDNDDDIDIEQEELTEAMDAITLEQENPSVMGKAGTKRTRSRQALGHVNY